MGVKALVMYLSLCYLRALVRLLSPFPDVEEGAEEKEKDEEKGKRPVSP